MAKHRRQVFHRTAVQSGPIAQIISALLINKRMLAIIMIKLKLKLKLKLTFVVAFLLFQSTSAFALGSVSRACSFLGIPENLRLSAALFFESINTGNIPLGFLSGPIQTGSLENNRVSDVEMGKYWVLESISTDYANVRYHLAAEAKIFRLRSGSTYGNRVMQQYAYYKTPWSGHKLDPNITNYAKFKAFFSLDRNAPGFVVYSTRAGNPDIIEKMDRTNFSPGQLPNIFPIVGWTSTTPNSALKNYTDSFWVIGNHYWKDINGAQSHYSKTEAVDCNLTQWGVFLGDR